MQLTPLTDRQAERLNGGGDGISFLPIDPCLAALYATDERLESRFAPIDPCRLALVFPIDQLLGN